MSMSMRVIGFRPPNAEWKKMKTVWDACHAAGISPPLEVERFFNHEAPDEAGVEISLCADYNDNAHPSTKKWSGDMKSGFEVDVSKLPEGLKIIRFVCSW